MCWFNLILKPRDLVVGLRQKVTQALARLSVRTWYKYRIHDASSAVPALLAHESCDERKALSAESDAANYCRGGVEDEG